MAKQKHCGIYKIINKVNGKFYIGSSDRLEKRKYEHWKLLKSGKHFNSHLQNAWNLYGENNFEFIIVEECEPSVQFEREQFYLDTLNPFGDNGYNIIRQISKEYSSDNYMTKKCVRCGEDYNTFSHLSKYCDKCKEEIEEITKEEWKHYIDQKIRQSDVILWGYDSWDDFWESSI